MNLKLPLSTAALVVLLVACSDGGGSSLVATDATATTDAPAATDGPAATNSTTVPAAGLDADGKVEFRETVVGFVENTVIAYGEHGLDEYVIAKAVAQTYPSISVDGSGIEATTSSISIYSNTLREKVEASATNPNIVAVAVVDTTGACLGGVAYGFPVATQHLEIDGLTSCTAQAVAEAALAKLGG